MKIAIASGKGGTGKTTLSVNLAHYLAEEQSVVLIDLDVEEPNSGLFLDGKLIHQEEMYKMVPEWNEDKCTLCGLCQQVCEFHAIIKMPKEIMVFPELCHGCYACSELCPQNTLPMIKKKMGILSHYSIGRMSFVEGRLDIGQEQAVPLISQTQDYVDEKFPNVDIKLYDSPPGTSCPVIEAAKPADFIILITEPTPFGLHDLQLAVETMREINKEFAVVINRAGIGNDDIFSYCRRENIPIIASIPNDRRIAELYSSGKLIYPDFPVVKKELQKIATFLSAISVDAQTAKLVLPENHQQQGGRR